MVTNLLQLKPDQNCCIDTIGNTLFPQDSLFSRHQVPHQLIGSRTWRTRRMSSASSSQKRRCAKQIPNISWTCCSSPILDTSPIFLAQISISTRDADSRHRNQEPACRCCSPSVWRGFRLSTTALSANCFRASANGQSWPCCKARRYRNGRYMRNLTEVQCSHVASCNSVTVDRETGSSKHEMEEGRVCCHCSNCFSRSHAVLAMSRRFILAHSEGGLV